MGIYDGTVYHLSPLPSSPSPLPLATTAPPEELFCNSFAACDTCVKQKPMNSSVRHWVMLDVYGIDRKGVLSGHVSTHSMHTVWLLVQASLPLLSPFPSPSPLSTQLGCYFCGSPGLSSNGSSLPACKAYTVANGLAVVTLNGGCPVLDYNVGTCVCKSAGQFAFCL